MNKVREALSMLGDIALGCVTLGALLFAVAVAGGLIIPAITELLIYPMLAPTLGSLGLAIQPGAISGCLTIFVLMVATVVWILRQ